MYTRSRCHALLLAAIGAILLSAAPAGAVTTSTVLVQAYTDDSIGSPTQIVAGPDDALWYVNRTGFSIGRISTSGAIDSFATPADAGFLYGITAGPDGALWFTAGFAIGRVTPSGVMTIFSGGPRGYVFPLGIATGPDGALWFTEPGLNAIGRIETSGVITHLYSGDGINQPWGITAGADGALWFTNRGDNTIGRLEVDGDVTSFAAQSIDMPMEIAAGSDGALWFTSFGNDAIGRIDTEGVVSSFTHPEIDGPFGMTAGGDGALWFTAQGRPAVGRITTSGRIDTFTGADITAPWGVAAGPDGALWFTSQDGIGRIAGAPAPDLVVPQGIFVAAASAAGRAVEFDVSVRDETDPSPTWSCAPGSGSVFPIGSTQVTCRAVDAEGNSTAADFVVYVKGATEQIADLIVTLDGYALDKVGSSLRDKLVAAQRHLEAGRNHQAEESLASFVAQTTAQRGKGLTDTQASELAAAAQQIIEVIET